MRFILLLLFISAFVVAACEYFIATNIQINLRCIVLDTRYTLLNLIKWDSEELTKITTLDLMNWSQLYVSYIKCNITFI